MTEPNTDFIDIGMVLMEPNTVDNIRGQFVEALEEGKFVMDKTGVMTIEIVGASFIANEETIFGPVNWDYVNREIEWYNSMSLNVYDIPGNTPKIWEQVSSKHGEINSNYGYLIYSEGNHGQYAAVLNELVANPDSRRAVMIYQRPTMHEDYKRDGMSDFICTNAVQYLIRDGKLDCVVQMRSNDVVFGYRNDRAWQYNVQKSLCADLNAAGVRCAMGDIHWQVGSLHVYERHFKFVK